MGSQDLTIIFSLASMGIFGGFSHCMSMCGPFVITQISSNLNNVKIENYHGIKKITEIALIPYHLGRITTYSLLGFAICYFRFLFDKNSKFEFFSAILIFLAGTFFLNLFFKENKKIFKKYLFSKPLFSLISKQFYKIKIHHYFFTKIKKLIPNFLTNIFSIIIAKTNFLLNNSKGLKGYVLGLMLGFIPCGMLYGAFALAGALSNPFYALIGMFIFGISTFFALFTVGFLTGYFAKLSEFKIIANIVILLNIFMLYKIFLDKFL